MNSELLLEVSLYILLLALIALLRLRRSSTTITDSARSASVPKRTAPAKKAGTKFVHRRSPVKSETARREVEEEASWRSAVVTAEVESKDRFIKPVAELLRATTMAQRVSKRTHGSRGVRTPPMVSSTTTPERKPAVVDLTRAFDRKPTVPTPGSPKAPPSSPNYVASARALESIDLYGLDPSFDQYIDYGEYYVDEVEGKVDEEVPVVPTGDPDHERRSRYLKRQVTEGEAMLDIGGYRICLIFIYGIEYHYCVNGDGSRTWDLPDDLKKRCQPWFLVLPKSKRKRMGLDVPPAPVAHEEVPAAGAPKFRPHRATGFTCFT